MAAQFDKLSDVMDYWLDAFNRQKSELEIENVQGYDETNVKGYPTIILAPQQVSKVPHSTHTFQFAWTLFFYVLHADLSASRATRSHDDTLLAEKVLEFIEVDKQLGGRVEFSFVSTVTSGALPSFLTMRESSSVCTRLTWIATSQGRFK